ncbi:hypothetical protein AMTRI_Chr09g21170 [Amborella trichopoda]
MEQWNSESLRESSTATVHPPHLLPDFHGSSELMEHLPSETRYNKRAESDVKDSITARKVQKADREKLRRDRLNEQFLELGSALDPDRPKNDKATILADTIQMLKDLTSQVNKFKSEYHSLSEESHELLQEKNELREEKATLKSDIESLQFQYQQRLRVIFPWASMDPSMVMGAPSPFPYPMPVPIPPGHHIPLHPSLQPFPFFGNQNPESIPNPYLAFPPYPAPANSHVERPSAQYGTPPLSHPSTTRFSQQEPRSKLSNSQQGSNANRSQDSNEIGTELELKTPGSDPNPEMSEERKKSKQCLSQCVIEKSCSSKCSSHGLQGSTSNSLGEGSVSDD